MIVDVHTHIWESPDQLGLAVAERLRMTVGDPWDIPIASPEAHDQAMQPVQHAIIHGFVSRYLDASIPPEQVARYVARDPKYLGFAGIDPMDPQCMAQLKESLELGLVGVTMSPAAQGYHPTHSRAMRLYDRCVREGLPVMIHPGTHFASTAKMEFAQPFLFDEVSRTFPELRIMIARVGHPWVDQTLVLIGKHRHVYTDLSDVITRPWELYSLLLSAHQQNVMGHLLLGSDFPFFTPEKAITALYSVNTLTQGTPLPNVPREQLRSIVERDARVCLGIVPREDSKRSQNDQPDSSKSPDADARRSSVNSSTPAVQEGL